MANKTVVAKTMMHCCHVNDTGHGQDAVIVSEMVEYDDGTTEPRLQEFKAPKISIYLTQPAYRDHADKKEFEELSKLDEFRVEYKHKDAEIFALLNNGFRPRYLTPNQRKSVVQSPYLYAGNIGIEARIGMAYKKKLEKAGKIPIPPTTGFFDIEQSLIPESFGELPLMAFVAENKVFLACNRKFMVDANGKPVTLDDIGAAVKRDLDPVIADIFATNDDLEEAKPKLPFTYTFFAANTELEMVLWIVDRMHETKVTFIGVWNIGFDIPQILKILEREGVSVTSVFADPKLRDKGMGYAEWREDKKDRAHWSLKWHWLSATAHFQFVDSMALYSYIRTVDGKEASYKLDDILAKFGLGGKLKVGQTQALQDLNEADWHREMLANHFVNYALYAIYDVVGLQMLEWVNNDLTTMQQQCDVTPPKFFPNQTINATNVLYEDWLGRGWVLGTGVDMEAERDDDLLTFGGAVLEPQNLNGKGIRLFKEWPNHHTRCYVWLNDVDFSAQYPTNALVLNISKQTKVCTMFSIYGSHVTPKYNPQEAVEILCSYLITPNANGVEMGTEFFNLPGYAEMNTLFAEHTQRH